MILRLRHAESAADHLLKSRHSADVTPILAGLHHGYRVVEGASRCDRVRDIVEQGASSASAIGADRARRDDPLSAQRWHK